MIKISQNRILVGFALFFLVLIANSISAYTWALFVLAVALLGFNEFEKLCSYRDIQSSQVWTRVSIAMFMIIPFFVNNDPRTFTIFLVQGVTVAITFLLLILRMLLKNSTKFEDIAASMWGVIYLGLLPSYLVWIRNLEQGLALIVILVVTIGLNDVAAMYVGRSWGQTPLSPEISPKKTVEGSIGGLIVASLSFYLLVSAYGFQGSISTILLLLLGLTLGLMGQIGDLLESLFKRGVGVKDSGSLFLSHGGVLDRTDSHFATAWLAYLIFAFLLI